MQTFFVALLATLFATAALAADPLPACSGSSVPICADSTGRVHIYAPITVHGTLNYFGTDSSDTVKLSSQGPGNGGVVLASDPTTHDYRPLNLRGDGITGQYKIEDPDSTPPTFSGKSLPGFKLYAYTGEFRVYKNLRIDGTVDFLQSSGAYFKGNGNYGYRWNNAADTQNLSQLQDDGTWRWHKYGATPTYSAGQRVLTVDAYGNIYTGPIETR